MLTSDDQQAALEKPPILNLFGIDFLNLNLADAADMVVSRACKNLSTRIFFVNAHCINVAAKDKTYYKTLREAEMLFSDGVGMAIAAKFWGKKFQDNVNGTDLFPLICKQAAEHGTPIALLGAKPGHATTCAEKMVSQYPGLRIVWTHHGYYPKEKLDRLIEGINNSGAKILFIAKGVPLQENWITENKSKLSVPVILGVGALFDFYSGATPRAPLILRKIKLEWLFRFLLEPKRMFKRYITGNPAFLFRAIKLRLLNKGLNE
ncbi:MAG TPA: glycosyltransferase [Chromatiales bacterium]|nr:glycosyltransferase [Thiotrichales bacterium]HIP68826.1 glycosyltransferase [Chromatiales bacterium]